MKKLTVLILLGTGLASAQCTPFWNILSHGLDCGLAGSSGGGGTGNAPSTHNVTPTGGIAAFVATSASAGTLENFVVPALTGNTTSTFAAATTGEWVTFNITQGNSTSFTFAVPSGFTPSCDVDPKLNSVTVATYWWDGTAGHRISCNSNSSGVKFTPVLFSTLDACSSKQAGAVSWISDELSLVIGTVVSVGGGSLGKSAQIGCDGTDYRIMSSGTALGTASAVNTVLSANVTGTDGTGNLITSNANSLAALNAGIGGGSANVQTASYTQPVTSLTQGLSLCWIPSASNTNSTPTFSPSTLTAHTVVKIPGDIPLSNNDILLNVNACAIYNTSSNVWELQNPQTASAGGVTGPGTTVVSSVPQWNNTAGTLLKAGLPITTGIGANSIPETDSSGNIGAGVNTANNLITSNGIVQYGFRIQPGLLQTVNCTAGAASISGSWSATVVNLNNQASCAITFSGGPAFGSMFIFLEEGTTTPTTTLSYVTMKGGPTAGGTTNQIYYMQCTEEDNVHILYCTQGSWN